MAIIHSTILFIFTPLWHAAISTASILLIIISFLEFLDWANGDDNMVGRYL